MRYMKMWKEEPEEEMRITKGLSKTMVPKRKRKRKEKAPDATGIA
jgi:hypothetical protein